jgi:hypothetical protein
MISKQEHQAPHFSYNTTTTSQAGAHKQLPRYLTHTCIKNHVQEYSRFRTTDTPQLMPPPLPNFPNFPPTHTKHKHKHKPSHRLPPSPSPLKPHTQFFPFSAQRASKTDAQGPGKLASARGGGWVGGWWRGWVVDRVQLAGSASSQKRAVASCHGPQTFCTADRACMQYGL